MIWRRHRMETFTALLALCEGNPLVTNNRDAGDLRRHRAHCHVAVMTLTQFDQTVIVGWIRNIYLAQLNTSSLRSLPPHNEASIGLPGPADVKIQHIFHHNFIPFLFIASWHVMPCHEMSWTCWLTRAKILDDRKSNSISQFWGASIGQNRMINSATAF